MRESERLRERLNQIEQAVSGDRHAESYREFETAYETLYIEHEQAVAALERAEARVAELEQALRMAFDVCAVLRRDLTPYEADTIHALICHVPGIKPVDVPYTRFGQPAKEATE